MFKTKKTSQASEEQHHVPIYSLSDIRPPRGHEIEYGSIVYLYHEGPTSKIDFDSAMKEFQKIADQTEYDAILGVTISPGVVKLIVPAHRLYIYGTGIKFVETAPTD